MTDSAISNFMTSKSPVVLSLLRFVTGLAFVEHGTQKLFNFPPSDHGTVAILSLIGVAGLLEFILGALVAAGLFTRLAAFILSGEMAVAYFMAHFPESFFPTLNGGDAAILFCFIFLYLAFAGGGAIALDKLIFKRS
jgi:putative oxidoreductase